jgi:hypothetical protein
MQSLLLVVDLVVGMVQIILLHHQEVQVVVGEVAMVTQLLADQEHQDKETMAVMEQVSRSIVEAAVVVLVPQEVMVHQIKVVLVAQD